MPSYIPPALPGHLWLRVRGRVRVFHYFHLAYGVSICSRALLTPQWSVEPPDGTAAPAIDEQCPDCHKLHLEVTGGHPDGMSRAVPHCWRQRLPWYHRGADRVRDFYWRSR